ncbi:MAG: hypothetical protein NW224_14685 [Leptolyngbyaceae cyanobacterium bins.302]|nr:hypothetical protein [Leptolyngbyaceae cyanobacterium bins.302]
MEFDQALDLVSGLFHRKVGRPLTPVEVTLLFGAWNNWNYDRISERSGYTINYLQRDIGPKFWKSLSEALGHKVNKTTLRATLTYLDDPLPPLPLHIQSTVDQAMEQSEARIF